MIKARKLNTEILFQLFVRYFKPRLICDIGTLDASHSILLRKTSKDAEIIAFEANPRNYQAIVNRDIGDAYGIEVVHKAVSRQSGQLVFHIQKPTNNKEDQWMTGTSSILQRAQAVGDTEEVTVDSTRLDDFLENRPPIPDTIALWIDVEGAGYDVLEGIAGIADNVAFLQVEVETEEIWKGQKLKKDVQSLMTSRGFIEIGRGKHEKQHDLVYVNKEFYRRHSGKCDFLVALAVFFFYVRKWGGHMLSDVLLTPFVGMWRKQ